MNFALTLVEGEGKLSCLLSLKKSQNQQAKSYPYSFPGNPDSMTYTLHSALSTLTKYYSDSQHSKLERGDRLKSEVRAWDHVEIGFVTKTK